MSEPSSNVPDLDELRALLAKAGDSRPPVEPDIEAILERAGQRVFRRRIGTGLALLGLLVPGVALAPGIVSRSGMPVAVVDGEATGLDCLATVDDLRLATGQCRFR